jgi:hypothetical protein
MSLTTRLERQLHAPGETVRGLVDVVESIDAREMVVAVEPARRPAGAGQPAARR